MKAEEAELGEELIAILMLDIRGQLWEGADVHRNGRGLEEGTDFKVMKDHLRSLEDNEEQGKAALLRCIATSATWPLLRKKEAGLILDATCRRCGEEDEDEFHRIWRCKDNLQLCDQAGDCITQTQKYAGEAEQGRDDFACLWTRGFFQKDGPTWVLP